MKIKHQGIADEKVMNTKLNEMKLIQQRLITFESKSFFKALAKGHTSWCPCYSVITKVLTYVIGRKKNYIQYYTPSLIICEAA